MDGFVYFQQDRNVSVRLSVSSGALRFRHLFRLIFRCHGKHITTVEANCKGRVVVVERGPRHVSLLPESPGHRRNWPQLAHSADYHNPTGQVIGTEQFAVGRGESGYAMLHSES